jgi:superfamily I DNA and/or RNA helicase
MENNLSNEEIDDHFQRLIQALEVERKEDLQQYQEKLSAVSFTAHRKNGLSWYPLRSCELKYEAGERTVVQVERYPEHTDYHNFQSGKLVRLFQAENDVEVKAHVQGVVNNVRKQTMTITLSTPNEPEWMDKHPIGVQLLFDDYSYREMTKETKEAHRLAKKKHYEITSTLIGNKSNQLNDEAQVGPNFLNESQVLAIKKSLSTPFVSAIHGPPGTGKTTTLIQLITELCSREKQVLVCAPSNTAVDLIVDRLSKNGINALRIGHPARVTEEALNHTVDVRFAKHSDYGLYSSLKKQSDEYFQLSKKYKRNFGPKEREQRRLLKNEAHQLKEDAKRIEQQIKDDLVFKTQVIVSTLVGANQSILKDLKVKTLIIDEAGQAMEPACWVAINKADRVIFAGDHLQLPPTVKSKEANDLGLSTTLLDRIMLKKELSSFLNTQYRMHQAIMEFSNEYFYDGKIVAAKSNAGHTVIDESPIQYIDTAGAGFEEAINPETLSTYNKEEASFLVKQLLRYKDLVEGRGVDWNSISVGVIAPYSAQVEVLKELLEGLGKNIKVSTVDGFQGQERDVIMISLVRSNDKAQIGFLKDYRRMNVAFTRARKKLIVIGDSATIGNDEFFKAFIDFAEQKGYYQSVFEYLYD